MKKTITIRSGGPQEWAGFNAIAEKHKKLAEAALVVRPAPKAKKRTESKARPAQPPVLQLAAKS